MSNTTNEEQEGTFNIPNNAGETHKENSPLIEHNELPNTPFHITGSKEKGYFLRLGDYRLTDIYKTEKQLFQQFEKQQWNIIMRMTGAIIERYTEQQKQKAGS